MERSWSALGDSWNRKKVVGVALGPSWGALGAEKPPNINLAIMEREAGEARECQALQEEQQMPPALEKLGIALETSWGALGPSWDALGPSWKPLALILNLNSMRPTFWTST